MSCSADLGERYARFTLGAPGPVPEPPVPFFSSPVPPEWDRYAAFSMGGAPSHRSGNANGASSRLVGDGTPKGDEAADAVNDEADALADAAAAGEDPDDLLAGFESWAEGYQDSYGHEPATPGPPLPIPPESAWGTCANKVTLGDPPTPHLVARSGARGRPTTAGSHAPTASVAAFYGNDATSPPVDDCRKELIGHAYGLTLENWDLVTWAVSVVLRENAGEALGSVLTNLITFLAPVPVRPRPAPLEGAPQIGGSVHRLQARFLLLRSRRLQRRYARPPQR